MTISSSPSGSYRPARRRTILALLTGAFAAAAWGQGNVVANVAGDDWSVPAWVTPAPGSGFFSESADPSRHVDLRVVDLTWRQLVPSPGLFSTTGTDSVYGMPFASWNTQLAGSDPYWLRLWVSGTDWAPAWAQSECGVSTVGVGYEGDGHLPIWNACLWGYAKQMLREVLVTRGLRSDPRLAFVYVPGAFTWCEFDFDIVTQAENAGALTHAGFTSWFSTMTADLVALMNGENADPSDDDAWKLVFTGEDYAWSPWGDADAFLARDAVTAGMGIRTGITELFNFHLSQVPAYGTTIGPTGYLETDEGAPAFHRGRTRATENECYNDCGFTTSDPEYAVRMSNLKALQLRMNRLYVVPAASYLDLYPEHWSWVRLSLGQSVYTAGDAWVALREAEDLFWADNSSVTWSGKPWIKNWERFLVQRDVAPEAITRRGTELHSHVLDPANGTAYEGRRTERAAERDRMLLFVDDRFAPPGRSGAYDLKVTYLDAGNGAFRVEYSSATGLRASDPVTLAGSGLWRTVTLRLDDAVWSNSLAHGADLALVALGPADLEARFVRLVRRERPTGIFLDGFDTAGAGIWSETRP